MLRLEVQTHAFGQPGIEPRWTGGNEDAVGTAYSAYSASSRLWFTLSGGILYEVYYPTNAKPQIRDLQYLITDGESFFHDERRHLDSTTRELSHQALGYEITSAERKGRYSPSTLASNIAALTCSASFALHSRRGTLTRSRSRL